MDTSTFETIVNTFLVILGIYQLALSLLHRMNKVPKSMITGYSALGSLLLGLGFLAIGLIDFIKSTYFLVPLVYLLPLCFGVHFTQEAKYTNKT
jgi:hypothetical protein